MRSAILKRREKVDKPIETEEPVRPADDPEGEASERPETLVSKLLDRLSGLKAKLIVPYLVLTLLTAMIGTFIVTRLVASSVRERFFNQ